MDEEDKGGRREDGSELAEAVGGAKAQAAVGGGKALGSVDIDDLVGATNSGSGSDAEAEEDGEAAAEGEGAGDEERAGGDGEGEEEEEAAELGEVDDRDDQHHADSLGQRVDNEEPELRSGQLCGRMCV